MNNKKSVFIFISIVALIALMAVVGLYLKRREPLILQGVIESTTYRASSKIAGRIDSMAVKLGDNVEKGEFLYRLSTPELDAQLEQAEAVKNAASALDNKVLSGARKGEITAARNLWQKALAGLQLAEKSFKRMQDLHNRGVIAAQQFDEAQANYQAAKATEQAAHAQYLLVRDGATADDKKAAAAKLQQAKGAVSEVSSYLSDAMVYSPINGEISSITAHACELVGSGFPVVAIVDLSDLWATFNIREDLMPHIHIGTTLPTYIPALDAKVDMQVYYISPQADFATWNATRTQGSFDIRTFEVRARSKSQPPHLRPGMSVLVDWSLIK